MVKQYFSKWRKRWIDFGSMDSEAEYKKANYRIRIKPVKIKRKIKARKGIKKKVISQKREKIVVNWNDIKSIKKAERQQTILYNKGYKEYKTIPGFNRTELFFKKIKKK